MFGVGDQSIEGLDYMYRQGPEAYRGRYPMEFRDRPDIVMEVLGAYEWIQEHRRTTTNGRLDIIETATHLEIPLGYYETKKREDGTLEGFEDGRLEGAGLDIGKAPLAVKMRYDLRYYNYLKTFGHEIGHYFLDEIHSIYSGGGISHLEEFCETFGAEMVLPLSELKNLDQVDRRTLDIVMNIYGCELETALFQLILAGKLPEKVQLISNIGFVPNENLRYKDEKYTFCLECRMSDDKAFIRKKLCDKPSPKMPVFDFRDTTREIMLISGFCRRFDREVLD